MSQVSRNDQIPSEFLSSIIQAKGFASFNEILQISPTNTFNNTMTNELIKFQFKTPDYIDPYDIYFDVQIESVAPPGFTYPSHRLYLDGNSNSIIQEVQIYSRSRHLETIRQHDQIMHIIDSIGFDPDSAASQAYLGYNVNNNQGGTGRQPCSYKNFTAHASFSSTSVGNATLSCPIGYLPQKGLARHFASPGVINPFATQNQIGPLVCVGSAGLTGSNNVNPVAKSSSPYFPLDLANNAPLNQLNSVLGFYNATLAAEGMDSFGGTRCEINEMFDGSLGVQGCNRPIIYETNTDPNHINTQNDFMYQPVDSVNGFVTRTHNLGFQSYWSTLTSEGNKCQWLDYGYGQTWIANGAIQDAPVASNILRVQIPLNSGVFGTLLPDHKLVPGKALGDTEIQIRLNPYAFFASGLARDADILDNGAGQVNLTNYQLPRAWKIKDIQLVIHTYSFDSTFTQQLEQQLNNGITLRSNGFDFAQSTSVADTRFLTGSWPIISGIQSLKALYIYFLDESYLVKTFCRKNFRVSGNVTSIQVKLNADYYPRRAVQGHAGNPIINSLSAFDNSEFIVWYQKQLGLFNTRQYTSINRVNFAINSRSYPTDLTATTTLPLSSKPNYKDYLLCGLPGQEEQRYVGKALYPFAFVQKPQKSNVLQGIDVSSLKPFEILIKTDQVNYYNKPVTLMILQHFNIEVNFTPNGTTVYGYA